MPKLNLAILVFCLYSVSFTLQSADNQAPIYQLEISCHTYLQRLMSLSKTAFDDKHIGLRVSRPYAINNQPKKSLGIHFTQSTSLSDRKLVCSNYPQEKYTLKQQFPRFQNMYLIDTETEDGNYVFKDISKKIRSNKYIHLISNESIVVGNDSNQRFWVTIDHAARNVEPDKSCIIVSEKKNDDLVEYKDFKITSDFKWMYYVESVKIIPESTDQNAVSSYVLDSLEENTTHYGIRKTAQIKAVNVGEVCNRVVDDDGSPVIKNKKQAVAIELDPGRTPGGFIQEVEIDAISVGDNTLRFVYVDKLQNSLSIDTEIRINELTLADGVYSLKCEQSIAAPDPATTEKTTGCQRAPSISNRDSRIDGYDSMPKFSSGNHEFISFIRRNDPKAETTRNSIQLVSNHKNVFDNSPSLNDLQNIVFDNKIIEYHWSCHGQCILAMLEEHGNSVVYQVESVDGWRTHSKPVVVWNKGFYAQGFIELNDGLDLALMKSSLIEPPALAVYNRADFSNDFEESMKKCVVEIFKSEKQTEVECPSVINKHYVDVNQPFPTVKDTVIETEEGDVHTFLLFPPGYEQGDHENQNYPTLVLVHGGPTDSWKNRYDPQLVSWAMAGYIVVLPNLVGSTGYGHDFTEKSRKGWGSTIYESLRLTVQSLLTESEYRIDSDNMAIMGQSFGGYMVALVAAKGLRLDKLPDFKFKAGVSINGIFDLRAWARLTDQFWYPADQLGFAPSSDDVDVLADPSAMVSELAEKSPPMLLIAGEDDIRVPHEQSASFHRALLDSCIPSRLVLFKDESHDLSSKTDSPLQAAVLTWLSDFMSVKAGYTLREKGADFSGSHDTVRNVSAVLGKYSIRGETDCQN